MAEETKLVTISMESIEGDVTKQVSVIAKRLKDKDGVYNIREYFLK